jgi:uridine kinase
MNSQQPPVLIAVVGGSGAGKTWLADRLQEALAARVSRLSLDDFYRDLSHLSFAQRERVNFDHPQAIDWPRLEEVLSGSLAGQAVRVPRYDFATHSRRPETETWQPQELVLCDGLWLLWRPAVRRLFARAIFVDCPAKRRLARRLERDQRERGRSRASVLKQFREDVAPMHERFVAPQARWADRVISSPMEQAVVREMVRELESLVRERRLRRSTGPT